jgi:hypothetical protein
VFPPAGAYVCRLVVLSFVRVLGAKSNTRLQGSKSDVRTMTKSKFELEATPRGGIPPVLRWMGRA